MIDRVLNPAGPITRRAALAAGAAAVLAPSAGAVAGSRDLGFAVYRKGGKIGEHAFRFAPHATGASRVTSELDLAVKLAFVTVYRYRQVGEEEWDGDLLLRTRIETDDDGEATRVTARADGGRLRVAGPVGDYALPMGAMTDLGFWHQRVTRQAVLIDSQNGELVPVAITPGPLEPVEAGGATIDARRFALVASRGRAGTVWFDADGLLARALIDTRGERLEYRRRA